MKNKNIILSVLHFFTKRNNQYDKRVIHPTREWLLGLAIFLALVAIGGIFCLQTFLFYSNLNTDGVESKDSVPVYNGALVHTALEIYTQRKNDFMSLRENVTTEIPVGDSQTDVSATKSGKDVEDVTNGAIDFVN